MTDRHPTCRICAVSGSLREGSTNSAMLGRAALLAEPHLEVSLWQGLADVPAFNPDRSEDPPEPVTEFRRLVAAADGLLIASPEYAHGVAGALKNALDWLVGSGELTDKPVALLNASPRATIAHAELAETLRTMGARIVADAAIGPLPEASRDRALADVLSILASVEPPIAIAATSGIIADPGKLRAGGGHG